MSTSIKRKFYAPATFDAVFAFAGALGAAGIVLDMFRAYPAVERAAAPLAKGGTMLAVLLAATAMAVATTRFDQKMADDFLFHTLTKSAFIAMFVILFTAALWRVLFERSYGMVSSNAFVGVLAAAWALSWCYTRLRGTGA